jgi:hypothetical protein
VVDIPEINPAKAVNGTSHDYYEISALNNDVLQTEQINIIFEWLDKLLDREDWQKARSVTLRKSRKKILYEDEHFSESKLKKQLLTSPWVPTKFGCMIPSQVFSRSKAAEILLGTALPCPRARPTNRVAEWLKMKQTVTPKDILSFLRTLSGLPREMWELEQISKLYFFLQSQPLQEKDDYKGNIVFYHPSPRWVTKDDCCWDAAIIEEDVCVLKNIYPNQLQTFFLEHLKVAQELEDSFYWKKWSQINEATKLDFKQQLWRKLADISQNSSPPSDLKVLTKSGHLCSPSDAYFPDNSQLTTLFAEAPIMWIDVASFLEFQKFSLLLRVRNISEEVKYSVTPGKSLPYLSFLSPGFQQAVVEYCKHCVEGELKLQEALNLLCGSKEQVVNGVNVTFSLSTHGTKSIKLLTFWDKRERCLYHSGSLTSIRMDLPDALADTLGRSTDDSFFPFIDFIRSVLGLEDPQIFKILEQKRWIEPSTTNASITNSLKMQPDTINSNDNSMEQTEQPVSTQDIAQQIQDFMKGEAQVTVPNFSFLTSPEAMPSIFSFSVLAKVAAGFSTQNLPNSAIKTIETVGLSLDTCIYPFFLWKTQYEIHLFIPWYIFLRL